MTAVLRPEVDDDEDRFPLEGKTPDAGLDPLEGLGSGQVMVPQSNCSPVELEHGIGSTLLGFHRKPAPIRWLGQP